MRSDRCLRLSLEPARCSVSTVRGGELWAPMVHIARYSAGMTLTRLVLLVMAVMVVIVVARTLFGSRR